MKVYNVHERRLDVPVDEAGKLLEGLAGPSDCLWPRDRWPSMALDNGLTPGSRGGHGPVRYHVSEVVPGRSVVFEFDDSGIAAGLRGRHYFEVSPVDDQSVIRHVIDAKCDPGMWLKWFAVIRPLHNALIEDGFDLAERTLHGTVRKPNRWNFWVRGLRALIAR